MSTTKYNFTPEGLQQKLTELYALTDPQLALEAAAVKTDFRLWMNNNFNLDTEQQTYLTGLDDRMVAYLGNEASFYFTYRLDIVLIQKPKPQQTAESEQLKWVHTENTTKVSSNDQGEFIATGTLIIKTVYE